MNPRERVPLGRTKLAVTRLGLGTAPLGGLLQAVGDREARATVASAYDLGLRLFDTAPLYGTGLSERRVGSVLQDLPRQTFVLSTKVGRLLRSDAPEDSTQYFQGQPLWKETSEVHVRFDYSYEGVVRSIEESLERLGLASIDVALIHDPDEHYAEALEGALPALAQLRREGRLGAVGVGMNQAEMLVRFAREGDFDCFLLAGRYTLLDQLGLDELLPLCLEKGIAVIAGGVYNSGILANPQPGATYDYVPAPPDVVERAQRLAAVCRRFAVPLKAAAIQFPLGHPAVASVVIGARSVAELDENLAMFNHPIPHQLWEEMRREGLLPPEAPAPLSDGPMGGES
jgi:D-threo-aldose 1-dehydrogenase